MKRHLLPGGLDRHGVTHPLRHDFDNDGLGIGYETEMDCAIGHDANRVIHAPARTPEDDAAIARIRRCAIGWALAATAGLAALLGLFGASCFRR